jgi:2,4-dienoyl-CoA reductase-like NADH-dependent reductase (Old Yellow Enzyme family)
MSDWHLTHLGTFAKGGAGLVIFEASGVQDIGRITPWDAGMFTQHKHTSEHILTLGHTGIYSDKHIAPLKRIVDFVHSQNAAAGIQLAHAGRKASTYPPHLIFPQPGAEVPKEKGGWQVVGPSPVLLPSSP